MHGPSWNSARVTFPALSRDQVIQRIKAAIPVLARQLPLRRVVLFGSYALGRHTAYSDIDLLVVYDDPALPDAFQRVRRAVDLRGLEPHVYTRSEAAQVAEVLERMTRDGIVLFPGDTGEVEAGPAAGTPAPSTPTEAN